MYFAHWTLTTPDGRSVHVSTPNDRLLDRAGARRAFACLLPKTFADWDEARDAGWALRPRLVASTHGAATTALRPDAGSPRVVSRAKFGSTGSFGPGPSGRSDGGGAPAVVRPPREARDGDG